MLRAIFLLSLIYLVYSCGFEKLQRPPLEYINTTTPKPQDGRILQETYENIRIYADYSYLESIDTAQRDYIQNQVMPSAISYYETTLRIKRLPETLQINALCAGYYPSVSLMNPGVDADLVIIVAAEYMPDQSFVAGAVPCGLSLIDNRPIYGLMLFNLAYLPMEKVTDHEENLSTALHEMAHIFGFNADFYQYFINPETGERLTGVLGQTVVNGRNMVYLNVEPLTSRLRTYFDCPTLEGAYLEDEGTSGSVGSHFERRVFMNEFMTASTVTEPVISEFTLALLEGSGWYQPYYNMTEPFNWGRGQGCEFLNNSCVDSQGVPNFSEFCDATVQKGCTFTARAIGFCGTGDLTDPFANQCPYYLSAKVFDCKDVTNQANAIVSAETYGLTSRCYTGTLVDNRYVPTYGALCFSTYCEEVGDSYQLTLQVGTQNITCANEGSISVTGYNGQIDCPDPNDFCIRANPRFCEKGCSGRGTCVNNQCQCPTGWGGPDCGERIFVTGENCTATGNDTDQGCYGDQIRSSDEIVFDETTLTFKTKSAQRIFAISVPLILGLALI